ncbi:MAG: SpoIIE family protein phosphatase [Desulfomonilaceae bacterium]|nr:SpoIIE family protein phosphatase [Desulfomonilaceae bacterium]
MKPSKVLVVEDHPISRKLLQTMLSKNYQAIAASSGPEAIDLSAKEKPDLILLDIDMPGMDGFQTLEILKREVIGPSVPVIFLTAREDTGSKEQGLEAGAVDYLTKPYDRHELSIKVKNHLALYEAGQEIEAKNRIMAREMEMASQLQSSLLPDHFPESDRLVFSVIYQPLSTAGGDFYDVVKLPDGRIAFAQVDVSGHGVASAMIGAMFKMAFQSLAALRVSPAGFLSTVNDHMFSVLPDSEFLTVFYGVIDPETLELVYTNAGHPMPYLHRRGADRIEQLSHGGPLIGAFPNMDYDEGRTELAGGDTILVFTDGVTETHSADMPDEFYGDERLQSIFLESLRKDPAEILPAILSDLEGFRGRAAFEDDITLLLISTR